MRNYDSVYSVHAHVADLLIHEVDIWIENE